jgi:hypothetical protein
MKSLEGKRPLGRPRRGWEDNIKMDLKAIGWGVMDCIQHRNEPWGSVKYLEILEWLSDRRLLKKDSAA